MASPQNFKLSDVEWREIQRVKCLSDEYRPRIEQVIKWYRIFETVDQTAHKTRTKLQDLRRQTFSLQKALSKIATDPIAHAALTTPTMPSAGWTRSHRPATRKDGQVQLEQTLLSIGDLAEWLSLARDRIAEMKPGANRRATNTLWFIADLDAIWRDATGDGITRSKKRTDQSREFIAAVCKIADPTIGAGSIEYAMQRHIRQKKRPR